MDDVFRQIDSVSGANEYEKLELMQSLKLRYFSPREVANLMCFPKHFGLYLFI